MFAARHPGLAFRRALSGHRWAMAPRSAIQRSLPRGAVVVEAGAADGEDTLWLQSLPEVEMVIAVEPHPRAAEFLRQRVSGLRKVIVVEAALSDRNGTASLHVSRDSGLLGTDSSSLLEPTAHLAEYPHVQFHEELEVETELLDSLLERIGVPRVDFLWLDLQGQELAVLRASKDVVRQVHAIYLEASRKPLYETACTFSDIQDFMSGEGLRMRVNQVGRVSGNALYAR